MESRLDRYDSERTDLEQVLAEWAHEDMDRLGTGEIALSRFGTDADTLDALYIINIYAQQVQWVVSMYVDYARGQGYTWREIGEALGVSRQAVKKRFGG